MHEASDSTTGLISRCGHPSVPGYGDGCLQVEVELAHPQMTRDIIPRTDAGEPSRCGTIETGGATHGFSTAGVKTATLTIVVSSKEEGLNTDETLCSAQSGVTLKQRSCARGMDALVSAANSGQEVKGKRDDPG